ncbi:hypothetical protein [Winogradskyella sp. Asnod2-B02-A]|uniref:hypothetical protein n=1 Tax=Winogradskyella sp. Asnod2-B02-A TaxID=3160583 RepID=UPI003863CF5D
MKKLAIIFSFCLITIISYAQVGVGTTSPDASSALDITSSDSGLLIPRVSIVNVNNNTTPIAAPAISLLVWNTNASVIGGSGAGYYYWSGTAWTPLSTLAVTANNGLTLTGNNVQLGGSLLGTATIIDVNNADIRFDLNAAGDFEIHDLGVKHFSVEDSGETHFGGYTHWRDESTSGTALASLTDGGGTGNDGVFTLYRNGFTQHILDGDGITVFNETGIDQDFKIESNNDADMFFVNGGTDRIGIGDNVPAAKLEINTGDNETALRVTKSTGDTNAAYIYNNGSSYGLYINNYNSSASAAGLAVIGRSDNQYAHGITAVSDGYYANVGMVTGGGETIDTGVTGINAGAEVVGVHGRANNSNLATTDKMGGFFNVSSSVGSVIPAAAAVGAVIDNTVYKIVGLGIVSTLVRDTDGEERIMVAPEAPEALFQDYGIGQLSNGRALIKLDPILTKNIAVDEDHPMKVFVQLEGDCNGVYVTNKTANGFEVVELNHGVSNTKFSYQIIANRADEEQGGRVSKYSEMRFKPFGRKFVVNKEAIHGPEEKNEGGNHSAVVSQESSSYIEEDHSLNQQEEIKSEKN